MWCWAQGALSVRNIGASGVCLPPHLSTVVSVECVCVCVYTPVHAHILERRRSAALCMMKPCIGYDFCLSDIHIHAWLSGRMYKIVAATLDSPSFSSSCAASAPTPPSEGWFSLCLNEVDEASWVQVSCSSSSSNTGAPQLWSILLSGY